MLKIVITLSIIVILILLPFWYFSKPVNDFCNSIYNDSTYDLVISKAKSKNYRYFNNIKNDSGTILVETQDMPMFRMGCEITFKDGKLINKVIITTD